MCEGLGGRGGGLLVCVLLDAVSCGQESNENDSEKQDCDCMLMYVRYFLSSTFKSARLR